MESKWHLFPGQTYENTKISERAHALHIKSKVWKDITRHLERKRRQQEEIEKEKAHKEALREASKAMTRNWENSFENIQLKKQKEKEEADKRDYEDKIKDYFRLKEGQKAVRDVYIEKVQKKMYASKGYAKDVNSALLLSEILYERDKQVEFNKFIQKHEDEVTLVDAYQLKDLHEKDKTDVAQEKYKRKEKDKKYRQELLKQIEDKTNCLNKQKERQQQTDAKYIQKTKEELDALEEFERNEKIQKMKLAKVEKKKALDEEQKHKQIVEQEEHEMENVINVCSTALERINCLRKQKEKELRDNAIAKREETAKKVFREAPDKYKNLEEQIRKHVEANDAKEAAKVARIKALQEEDKRNKILGRQEYLQKKEEEERCLREMKKWELLNILKNEEATKEYDRQRIIQRWKDMLKVRKDLLDQIAEKQEIEKEEKRIDEIMSFVDLEAEDKKFFDYANEVLELAKSKGRSTYPIEKVIQRYKKDFGLK